MDLKFIETLELNSLICGTFMCEYSTDDRLAILTEAGVYILTLIGDISLPFGRYNFDKYLLKPRAISIVHSYPNIDLVDLIQKLPRNEFNEAMHHEIGTAFEDIEEYEIQTVKAQWSPRGLIKGTECALGLLTNQHSLQIFYSVIAPYSKTDRFTVEKLKKSIDYVIPTAFSWSPLFICDSDQYAILLVAHRYGEVSLWKFPKLEVDNGVPTKLQFLIRVQTRMQETSVIHWHSTTSRDGTIFMGDKAGRIAGLRIKTVNDKLTNSEDDELLYDKCDIGCDKIVTFSHQNITFLIVLKLNTLFVYAVQSNGNTFTKIHDISPMYCAVGLEYYQDNTILICTLTGHVKLLSFSINSCGILVSHCVDLPNIIDSTQFVVRGIIMSRNRLFLGILHSPQREKDVKRTNRVANLTLFADTSKDPLKIVLYDEKTSLRDYWDCFETLRVRCIQEKRFPWTHIEDVTDLKYDQLSLIQLKVLRIIAKLSECVYDLIPHVQDYEIKPYVLLNYAVDVKLAVERIKYLLDRHFTTNLSQFQLQSLDILNFFVKEMVVKDVLRKLGVCNHKFLNELTDVITIANEIKYPQLPICMWCGEKILGLNCVPYHPDSRCAISLMPLGLDSCGFYCVFCKCVVSSRLQSEFSPIFCPYCDIPMETKRFPLSPVDVSDVPFKTDCFDDCLSVSSTDFTDVLVENDGLILLSDDDETDTQLSRIKTLVLSHCDVSE